MFNVYLASTYFFIMMVSLPFSMVCAYQPLLSSKVPPAGPTNPFTLSVEWQNSVAESSILKLKSIDGIVPILHNLLPDNIDCLADVIKEKKMISVTLRHPKALESLQLLSCRLKEMRSSTLLGASTVVSSSQVLDVCYNNYHFVLN